MCSGDSGRGGASSARSSSVSSLRVPLSMRLRTKPGRPTLGSGVATVVRTRGRRRPPGVSDAVLSPSERPALPLLMLLSSHATRPHADALVALLLPARCALRALPRAAEEPGVTQCRRLPSERLPGVLMGTDALGVARALPPCMPTVTVAAAAAAPPLPPPAAGSRLLPPK